MPPSEIRKPRKWASNALFSPHFRLGDQRGDQELDLSSLGNGRGQGYKASPWEHPGHLAAMTLYLKRMSPPPQPCESRTSPLLDLCLCLCLFSHSHPKARRSPGLHFSRDHIAWGSLPTGNPPFWIWIMM